MPVEWQEHRAQKMLYIDFGGARELPEFLEIHRLAVEEMRASGTFVRVLSDFSEVELPPGFLEAMARFSEQRDRVVLKTAIVATRTKNRKLLDYYRKFVGGDSIRGFETCEAARDWLVH